MPQASCLVTDELVVIPVICHQIVSPHVLAQDLRILFKVSSWYFWESSRSSTYMLRKKSMICPACFGDIWASKLLSRVLFLGTPKAAKAQRCLYLKAHKSPQEQSPLWFCLPPLLTRRSDLASESKQNIRPCYCRKANFTTTKYVFRYKDYFELKTFKPQQIQEKPFIQLLKFILERGPVPGRQL